MRKKLAVALSILFLLSGCGRQSEPAETQMAEVVVTETQSETQPTETQIGISETALAYLERYRSVLDLYAQAQTEQWDGQQFTAAGLSNQAYGWLSVQQKLGCGLVDLDADGVMLCKVGASSYCQMEILIFLLFPI